MPRGNDAEQAKADLQKQLGITLNAEELIEANQKRFSKELRATSNKRTNEAAGNALTATDLAKHVPGPVIDWNVRGDSVVVVYTDSDGRDEKAVVALDDLGAQGKKAAEAEPPAEDEDTPPRQRRKK